MTADITTLVKHGLIAELETLRDAVKQTAAGLSDDQLWRKPLEPGNSVGHLILHLTGNLNTFVGAQLGQTGYVRDREREFTESNPPPRADLLTGLDAAVATFGRVVAALPAATLAQPHPEARLGPVVQALLHLVAHFALHRGQITYIARLVQRPA